MEIEWYVRAIAQLSCLIWCFQLINYNSGESRSQKEVMNAISSMNIQVDNLCQFLPQDKVAEFAQVNIGNAHKFNREANVMANDYGSSRHRNCLKEHKLP